MTKATSKQKLKSYQKGTFTLGDRLASGTIRSDDGPVAKSDVVSFGGHTACPGCGVTLAARHVAEACRGHDIRILVHHGDEPGDLPEIFARNDDVLCLCYDSEGAGALSSPDALARAGKIFELAMAHRIPYVATATVADLRDLQAKLTKAMAMSGSRSLHIHAPCPALGGTLPNNTIRLARLAVESGFFPVFEAERGIVTGGHPVRHRLPIVPYLKLQQRFVNISGEDPLIATLQAIADHNIAEFGLLPHQDDN